MVPDAKALRLDVVDQRCEHDASGFVFLDLLVLEKRRFTVFEFDRDVYSVDRSRLWPR